MLFNTNQDVDYNRSIDYIKAIDKGSLEQQISSEQHGLTLLTKISGRILMKLTIL